MLSELQIARIEDLRCNNTLMAEISLELEG